MRVLEMEQPILYEGRRGEDKRVSRSSLEGVERESGVSTGRKEAKKLNKQTSAVATGRRRSGQEVEGRQDGRKAGSSQTL